jgi:hypothetical protein
MRNLVFPNYQSVCATYVCSYVAAANWEQIVVGITPSATMLKSSYLTADPRGLNGLSSNFLWTQWTTSGIDGRYLSLKTAVPKNESSVESAIKSSRGIFAQLWLPLPATVGGVRWGAGTKLLVADGYTPQGPLVIYQGTTLAMTWSQWSHYQQGAWELAVSASAPGKTTLPAGTVQTPIASLSLNTNSVEASGGVVLATFSSTNASVCSLQTAVNILASPVSVPCNGTFPLQIPASSTGGSFVVVFTATSSSGSTITSSQTITQNAPSTVTQLASNYSTNWSGYVVPSSSSLITDAEGSWVVPRLNCADTPTGSVSLWIGIGGQEWATGGSSGALLQTGISLSCAGGVQFNSAWWELVPASPNHEETFSSFPIAVGDTISASVYEATTGAWQTKVTDSNTGLSAYMITGLQWGVGTTSSGQFSDQGSTNLLSYSGGYTAEWIVEDSENATTQALHPLANFGTVTFTNLLSSFTSWSLTPDETWAIAQSGVTLATPISTTTDGFSVIYTGP